MRWLIKKIHAIIVDIEYEGFFEPYDIIAVVGIETYCDALMPYLDKNKNVVLHHVNHQFQFERNYFDECPQDKIVILDAQQELEIRNSSLTDPSLYHLPLSMKLSDRPNLNSKIVGTKPVRIGVVSRLFADRPNEPLLRCFHAVAQAVDARLYFYGSGNPKLYDQIVDELNIRDKVLFMGHQEDLEHSIIRDKLSMLWLVSMGSSISYGSIEVASFGIPMVFWNLSAMTYEQILADTNGAMHSFSDINQFVEFNKKVLKDPGMLKSVGIKLREFVLGKFEIANYIDALQKYYEGIAADATGAGDNSQ
ncbi:MAG TPA: glycosyltransferase [Mucilaginibacter sp.]|nr:glycosyltransferase [Mucilaginibacter sp.]